MASVSADDVRDVINVSSTDIADAKLNKMLKDAEVTLELETGDSIDYSNCTEKQALFIKLQATIYAICYLTGGSALGLSFSVGNENVSILERSPPLTQIVAERDRVLRLLTGTLKRV